MTEGRLIAILVGIILFLGAVFFGLRAVYDAGHSAGVSETTAQWDADKIAIQKVTDAAIAQATAERDMALKSNEAIQNDYQSKLTAATANAADFALRLRNAETLIAANRSNNSKAGGGSESATASAASSTDQLGQLVALVTDFRTECKANSDQLDSLISEIKPQLGVQK